MSSDPHHLELAKSNHQEYHDCLSCRLVGTGVFVGAGVYTYVSGRAALRENQAKILKSGSMFGPRSRHLALGATSAALIGAGVYRWLN